MALVPQRVHLCIAVLTTSSTVSCTPTATSIAIIPWILVLCARHTKMLLAQLLIGQSIKPFRRALNQLLTMTSH